MYNFTQLNPDQCEFVSIGPADELIEGERWFIDLGSETLVVINVKGTIFALADVCSHDDGPLGDGEVEGYEIICPRHGARFDIRSGRATSLPAIVDIPAYPVRIVGGEIEVGVPLDQ